MVRQRNGGGPKRTPTSDSSVVGQFKAGGWHSLLSWRRRVLWIAASGVVVIAVMVGLVLWHQISTNSTTKKMLPTPEQAKKDGLKQLTDNPVSDTASSQAKADYYYNLAYSKAENNDYKGAVAALIQVQQLQTGRLQYADYIYLANWYHQLHEPQEVASALDQAGKVIPPADADGYDPGDSMRQQIATLKQEYVK